MYRAHKEGVQLLKRGLQPRLRSGGAAGSPAALRLCSAALETVPLPPGVCLQSRHLSMTLIKFAAGLEKKAVAQAKATGSSEQCLNVSYLDLPQWSALTGAAQARPGYQELWACGQHMLRP